jgi:hypothetical protein
MYGSRFSKPNRYKVTKVFKGDDVVEGADETLVSWKNLQLIHHRRLTVVAKAVGSTAWSVFVNVEEGEVLGLF